MKISKGIKYIVGAMSLIVAMLVCGCGPTHQVLKSGNADMIYNYALELYEDEDWNDAATLFQAVSSFYDGSSRDDSVKFFSARCRFKNGEFQVAAQALDEFRRQYGRSPFLEDAEGMYTLCHYYMAPSSKRDSGMITNAITIINEFISRYPNSTKIDVFYEIRDTLVQRLHEKSYANAYTYYKTGYYKSAIIAFRNALKEYPESEYRELISYYTVASAYELGANSVEGKKEDRFLDMRDAYYTFIAAYPESEYRGEVDKMLKRANNYIESKKNGISEGEEKEASEETSEDKE